MPSSWIESANPLVSVVIPAHNSASTLKRALESVSRQSYRPLEIIVVDDASSDSTRDVLRETGVRAIFLSENAGASAARNCGIEAASGDYIAFLDADDEWLPGKLAKQMALIAADDRMSFVACAAEQIGPDGARIGPLHPPVRRPAVGTEAWKTLLAYTFVATPCIVTRRRAVLEVGGFNPELTIAEDQDLWIRLALYGSVGYVDEVLVRVHASPTSLTARYNPQTAALTLPVITRHIAANRHLLSRREVRHILGTRYSSFGRNAYLSGQYDQGLRFIAKAIVLGHRPVENLWYLVSASPLSRWLKDALGISRTTRRHVGV
jgi:glycosyltransferase involved in cell wall biosynthesis